MGLEERIARLSPAKLALLERKLEEQRPADRPKTTSPAGSAPERAPLSFSQERLWFLEQMEPERGIYNLPELMLLPEPVDPGLLEESLLLLVGRHSALRTRFVVEDERPTQVIGDDPARALDFSIIDLRGAKADRAAASLSRILNDETWAPFKLSTGPLLRVRLILQPDNNSFLLIVTHHIVSDGWSIRIFTSELRALYQARLKGTEHNLGPAPLQYADYSIAQRQSLVGEKLDSLISYWRHQLDEAPSVLPLLLDHRRPARQSFKGALHCFEVPLPSVEKLKSLCRESEVVPFMALLGVFKALLHRYTGESRIVVGTPIANRNRSELENVIGFFTNTLVLCTTIAPDMTFREVLAEVRKTTLGAYEHQDLPFEKLVSEMQPERSLGHNPLFQVMFTFQNFPVDRASVAEPARHGDLGAQHPGIDVKLSKFDLTLAMTETGDGLSAVFEYATDLFEPDTIERMAVHFLNFLHHVTHDPDVSLARVAMLSAEERRQILTDWNATDHEWPEILPLHGGLERWAQTAPDSAALTFRDSDLTYRELDRRSNHVAGLLRGQSVGRGDVVGICTPRSLEMVVGLFGILKTGAAYMPIELDLPAERVAYMLEQARVKEVLTTSGSLAPAVSGAVHAIAIDELNFAADAADPPAPAVDVHPADVAYVLFTSGSTGEPKGVMVSHGAIGNRLNWMQERYGLGTDDRVMQKTPYGFDVSVWEFFWPLSQGACLVIAEPGRHKESAYLVELIKSRGVTCLHFVPSMLQLFLQEDLTGCQSLKRIICSGEALSIQQCRRLQELPNASAHNLYGPTEAAVDVTHWDCSEWRDQYLSVPIGRPIANTQIYILNEVLEPAPIGVPGELYIGGRNLANGYLNRPDLTASQFVPNPFITAPDARLYKTGDLARFRRDGNIEYIGRIDSQVKLRGLRIELGEIEFHLRRYFGIGDAVVVVHGFAEHDERLVGYVVPEDPELTVDAAAIRAYLAEKLPPYMVPAMLVTLDKLPLTANGKLDRKRLPEPAAPSAAEPRPPASEIERELIDIFRSHLTVDRIGIDDDFFALGGHSLLATRVVNSINAHYHLNTSVRMLFESPTVRSLARTLSEFEDEAWLIESKTAASMLEGAPRRVLHHLDELTEEEIDSYLEEYLGTPALAGFEDGDEVVRWSRRYLSSRTTPTAAEVHTAVAPSTPGGDPADPHFFWGHYTELTRIWSEAGKLNQFAGNGGPPQPEAASNGAAHGLRTERDRVFESFVHGLRQRLVGQANGILSPADLRDVCGQMIWIAEIASRTPLEPSDADPVGEDERIVT